MSGRTPPVRMVALFRGINVGKAKRVAMEDLREVARSLGYRDVSTVGNSGNLVFTGQRRPDPAPAIESGLAARTGVHSRVTIVTEGELAETLAGGPFAGCDVDPSRYLLAFVSDADRLAAVHPLVHRDHGASRLAISGSVIHALCADGILGSRMLEEMSKLLGDGVTTRNLTTARKLLAACTATPVGAAVRGGGAAPRRPSAPARSRPRTSRTGRPARSR